MQCVAENMRVDYVHMQVKERKWEVILMKFNLLKIGYTYSEKRILVGG